MDARLRYAPVAALLLLVVIRLFDGDFLAAPIVPSVPLLAWISWFGVLFTALAYLSAYILTPGFVAGINAIARVGFLPPVIVLGGIIVLLWAADFTWNSMIDPWCGPCGESRMLASVTGAISGGGEPTPDPYGGT